jgi:hypothetical protein
LCYRCQRLRGNEALTAPGYRECRTAFVETQFSASYEDELAWLLAGHHPRGELLFFSSQLKTLFLGWPTEAAGLMHLESATDSMLNYLKPEERGQLLGMAARIAEQLGDDNHNNVGLTLGRVLLELLGSEPEGAPRG